jgi:site-specific recombinase XerC
LLLDYGLRKGALQTIQFTHFDHQRQRVTIFTKGEKVRQIPTHTRSPLHRRPASTRHTGNIKAVQMLLGHASIRTTGDLYTDWDINQLETTLTEVFDDEH